MKIRQEETEEAALLHFVACSLPRLSGLHSQSCPGPDASAPRADTSCFGTDICW